MEEDSKETKKETCLLESAIITIKDFEHNATPILSLQSSYVTYQIKTRPLIKDKAASLYGINKTILVWRRYSDFETLREKLATSYPAIIVPPLPEKRVNPTLDGMVTYAWHKLLLEVNEDEEFLERRKKRLEKFLQRIAIHPTLCKDAHFLAFLSEEGELNGLGCSLTTRNDRLPSLNESPLPPRIDTLALNLLDYMSSNHTTDANGTSLELSKNSDRWKSVETYASSLSGHISSLLKIRKEMIEKLYLIHKIHGNYGRIFFEWSKTESDLGDVLTKAGKLMTEYALVVDNFVSAEEDWEDNLREYESYADILKGLCKRYNLLLSRFKSSQSSYLSNPTSNGAIDKRLDEVTPPSSSPPSANNCITVKDSPTASLRDESNINGHGNISTTVAHHPLTSSINGLKNVFGVKNLSLSSPPQNLNPKESIALCNNVGPDGGSEELKEFETARQALIDYDNQAMSEVRTFQKQKDREIRNFLKEYAQNQVQLNAKSLDIWSRMRETFATF